MLIASEIFGALYKSKVLKDLFNNLMFLQKYFKNMNGRKNKW